MTSERLISWKQHLEQAGWSPVGLRPGLDPEQVMLMLTGAGLQPIQPLMDLYTFADGTDKINNSRKGLFFDAGFLPLQEALDQRIENLSYVEPEDPTPEYKPHFLPVFSHDPTLVIDTSKPDGPILEVWWDSECQTAYADIAAYTQALKAQLDSGQLVLTDGRLRKPPSNLKVPPKRIAGFHYVVGYKDPPDQVPNVVVLLPEILANSGDTEFRVYSRVKGELPNNNDLEPQQLADLQARLAQVPGIEKYQITWHTHPPRLITRASHHRIDMFRESDMAEYEAP